jgi:hypothetical protein
MLDGFLEIYYHGEVIECYCFLWRNANVYLGVKVQGASFVEYLLK